MMKLEIKHLAPYLPYKLKCTNNKESYLQTGEDRTGFLEQLSIEEKESVIMGKGGYFLVSISEIVPILKPLSDLKKEIKFNNEVFIPVQRLEELYGINDEFFKWDEPAFLKEWLYYGAFCSLFEWHFDVFGLIEKGLAIDVNI